MFLRAAANAVLGVVLAPRCGVCDAVLADIFTGPICDACRASITIFRPPLCARCGMPVGWSVALCGACDGIDAPVLARVASIGPYEGVLRDAIHLLKYDERRALAAWLAALMRVHGAPVLAGADAAVPVPLHWRRRRVRGFNQAADLAAGLGLPVVHALVRGRPTVPQVSLTAGDRHRNLAGAFRAPRRWRPIGGRRARSVAGLTVVVVDDVSTTGATLEACAVALRRAGAVEVRALVAARTVSSRP
jgi:ComF family protein